MELPKGSSASARAHWTRRKDVEKAVNKPKSDNASYGAVQKRNVSSSGATFDVSGEDASKRGIESDNPRLLIDASTP